MPVRIIRASEIGSYLYCRRAWWYQRQGVESQNTLELTGGSELHRRHGQSVMVSGCLRWLAYALLLLGLAALVAALAGQLV